MGGFCCVNLRNVFRQGKKAAKFWFVGVLKVNRLYQKDGHFWAV